jgi:hypothetical protein
MHLSKKKYVQILSDGSLNFSYSNEFKFTQCVVYEKDNRNFHLNKKQKMLATQTESSSGYKKKYGA